MTDNSDANIVNRRRFPRHDCAGAVEIFRDDSSCGWGKMNEISLGGCYIEAERTLPPGTEARLKVTIRELPLEITAQVISEDTASGMGMEFVSTSAEQRGTLAQILMKLAGVQPVAVAAEPLPETLASMVAALPPEKAARILSLVVEQMNQSGAMTRPELFSLVKSYQ